ncbi:MAG: hypothetical protein HQK56_06115 [Deltaproteobacteria bacterium]|nr:hypothetical protein [Deltaproteobacteria bacterium]
MNVVTDSKTAPEEKPGWRDFDEPFHSGAQPHPKNNDSFIVIPNECEVS